MTKKKTQEDYFLDFVRENNLSVTIYDNSQGGHTYDYTKSVEVYVAGKRMKLNQVQQKRFFIGYREDGSSFMGHPMFWNTGLKWC